MELIVAYLLGVVACCVLGLIVWIIAGPVYEIVSQGIYEVRDLIHRHTGRWVHYGKKWTLYRQDGQYVLALGDRKEFQNLLALEKGCGFYVEPLVGLFAASEREKERLVHQGTRVVKCLATASERGPSIYEVTCSCSSRNGFIC